MSNNLKKLSGLVLVLSLAFSPAQPGDSKDGAFKKYVSNHALKWAAGGAVVGVGALAYDYSVNYKAWYDAQPDEWRESNPMGLSNYLSEYLMGFKGETPSKVAQVAGTLGAVAGLGGGLIGLKKMWSNSSTPDRSDLDKAEQTHKDKKAAHEAKLKELAKELGLTNDDDINNFASGWSKDDADRSPEEKAVIDPYLESDRSLKATVTGDKAKAAHKAVADAKGEMDKAAKDEKEKKDEFDAKNKDNKKGKGSASSDSK